MSRVVVVGDVMTDLIVRPEGELLRGADRRASIRAHGGGSGANQAAWLASLGLSVTLVARVGADDAPTHRTELAAHGVEPALAIDAALPSGRLVTILAPDGERSFLTDRGANDALCAADLPQDLLARARHLHVSGYALVAPGPRAAVLDYARAARGLGLSTSLDPPSSSFIEEIGAATFLDATRDFAIVFPNEAEASALTGETAPERQAAALGRVYELVVLKRGMHVALARDRHGASWSLTADPTGIVDTTGAGDAFAAAYLAAHLSGLPVAACLERAVALGTSAARQPGGRPPRHLP